MRRLRKTLSLCAAATLLLTAFGAPKPAEAQEDLLILVAPLSVTEPVRDRFGQRVAEEIRDLLRPFPGYRAIDRGDARDMIDDFDLEEDEMSFIEWRQLATQMGAQLLMWGTAESSGAAVVVDVTFIEPNTGDELPIEPFTVVDDDEHEEAAALIMAQLGEAVQYARAVAFCSDYLSSGQATDAINNCNTALELSPASMRARYLRGRAQMLQEAWGAAVTDLEAVVGEEASNTEALEALAFTYAQLGEGERSIENYRRFLEFQPEAVEVRLRIAYDLTQAEQWVEAVSLLEEGVERAPDNVSLLEYLASAALQAGQTQGEVTDTAMTRRALEASTQLVDIQGSSVSPTTLTNATNAYMLLGDYEDALAFSARALDAIRNSDSSADEDGGEEDAPAGPSQDELLAQVHASRAQIHDRLDDPQSALVEQEQAINLDPDINDGRFRLGLFRLRTGDLEGAEVDFAAAVEAGRESNHVAEAIFSEGYATHFEAQQGLLNNAAAVNVSAVRSAVTMWTRALEFASIPGTTNQIHFFLAFAGYLEGSAFDARNEEDEACGPARSALAAFQGVATHLGQAGDYQASSQASIREASGDQIFRQESIIEANCQV